MPPHAPEAAHTHVLASLIVDSGTSAVAVDADGASSREPKSRPLIHLAAVSGDGTNAGDTEPAYALGVPVSGHVRWHGVGRLDLAALAVERVLLAGLSVLAMKHLRDADVHIGDPVLVFGADPWSLLLLQWAKLQGASPLVFVCRGPRSLSENASSLGVDATLSDPAPGDFARAAKVTHRAAGFAIALDAIASEQSMTQALAVLRDGGRYVLAGLDPQPYVLLNAYPNLHRRDLEIVSSMHGPIDADFAGMFRFSFTLADQGRLRLDGLLDPPCGWRTVTTETAP